MCGDSGTRTVSSGDAEALALLRLAPVVICDANLRIRHWSAGAERLYGWSASDARGNALDALLATAFPKPYAEVRADMLRGTSWRGELQHRARDGRTVYVTSLWTLQRDEGGLGPTIATLDHDISERIAAEKQAKTEAKDRDALLQAIMATVPEAMVTIDEKGTIQSFSAIAERLFGYRAEEMLGKNISTLMPSPYREQHDGYIARYLSTGERRIIGTGRIVVGQRKDGYVFPVELAVGEVKLRERRLFTGFIRDLTEHQERERRFQQVQSELIHVSRVTELGQTVSALAHEVNQPLTAISNYVGACRRLLAMGNKQAAEASLQKVSEQTERARGIVGRLREFVSKRETEKRAESLPKTIEEASALALVGAKAKGVKVEMAFDPTVPGAIIDKIQIQQVVFNLVRNAIEAMEAVETRELTIATGRRDENLVEISVMDSGPGLSEQVRAKLFQPFVTTKPSGMGVGLSICRSIVASHGGQLWADDNPRGGTIFRFTVRRTTS